jgi:hypothetical protein
VLHSASERVIEFWINRDDSRLANPDRETVRHYIEQLKKIEKRQVAWEEASFETIPVSDPNFLDKLSDCIGGQITFDRSRGCHSDNANRTFQELKDQFVAARPTVAYAH